ncbi:MAG: undecaprenyl-diphosphate phosphatase [Dehalococcoidia bacterium]
MEASLDEYLRAIVLGLVQALTEFLPISSSGHLVLAPRLLGGEASSLTFDVGLHAGTLLAVFVYFWRDWARMVVCLAEDVPRHGRRLGAWQDHSRLALWIALATLPTAVAGFALDATAAEWFRAPVSVAVALLVFSGVIWVLDRRGAQHLDLSSVTPRRALIVGAAQAVALIPGTSRSGITIAAARGLGFDRPSAARFSFLLSAPAVGGAAVLKLGGALAGAEAVAWGPLLVGAVTAALGGLMVIRGLLRFLQSRTLAAFVWYRVVLAVVVLVAVALDLI